MSSSTSTSTAPSTAVDGSTAPSIIGPSTTLLGQNNNANMDAIMAQELNQLSLEDRERICDEIHGVHTLAVTETPELITERLSAMEQVLLETQHHYHPRQHQDHVTMERGASNDNSHGNRFASTTKNDGYIEALQSGCQYVHEPAFRLMFLRAEQFDATLAAGRLIKFMQVIRDYFGPEFLVNQPWLLTAFTTEELNIFKRGAMQPLPGRDRFGRRIIGVLDDYGEVVSIPLLLKITLYVYMATAEDEQTQQRGTVCLFYQSNPSTTALFRVEERAAIQKLIECVPLRNSANHVCFPDSPGFAIAKNLLMATANRMYRTRMRFHTGSLTELLYSLQTFGISPDQVPINTCTGTVKTQFFLKWINMRQAMEEARASGGPNNNPFQGIECPRNEDVLLGRGRPIMNHGGNLIMRHAVESRLARFAAANNKEARAAIIWEVIQEIHKLGGRFLKEDPKKNGWWVEVDHEAAKQKVAINFRDLKYYKKAVTSKASTDQRSLTIPLNLPSWSSPLLSSTLTMPQIAGRIPSRRQELDSSTYDFLEGSSRAHKRYKANHHNNTCGNFCGT